MDQGEQLNWPQASTKTRTRFDELITTTAQGFKTEGWIRLCRRFLFLAEMSATERFAWMRRAKETHKWQCSTTATYWGAHMSNSKLLHGRYEDADLRTAALFEKQAREELTHYPATMRVVDLHHLLQRPSPTHTAHAATLLISVAFTIGGRISDVALLQVEDVILIGPFLALTFRRGKTVAYTRPFTVHLDIRHAACPHLVPYAWSQKPGVPLFLGYTRDVLLNTARELLRSLPTPNLELRSVRRGGLTTMALHGVPLEDIRRLFSHHSTAGMLRRYLQDGAVDLAGAARTALISQTVMHGTQQQYPSQYPQRTQTASASTQKC